MSINPNNAVGTNAAYDGRTSVKAFNDGIGAYSRGILSGWDCSPSTGMTVSLGGDGTTRDIAIAEDVAGNKTTINNISEAPISVTMSAAPSTNSRIDVIVAYVDNPPQGSATSIDNPGACGLIAVDGTAAADPVAPNDSAIRTAITADGASGSTAYYVVLATITIASGTTDLTADNIAAGPSAGIRAQNIDFTTMNTAEIKSTSASVGYSVICAYKRLGNIVIATVDNPVNTNLPAAADNEYLSETIPVGFRPAYNTSLNLATGGVQSRTGNISFLMKSDGSIRLNSAHMGDGGAVRLNGVSIWFTSDAYPN